MIRRTGLALVLSLLCSAAAAQAETDAELADTGAADTKVAVLALDSARIGQERYLMRLLRLPETTRLTDANIEPCRIESRESMEDSEACLRYRNGAEETTHRRPVLILENARIHDPDRDGLASLVCVGAGAEPSDPERQTIHLWPRAYGLHSVNPYIRDREALEACIAAAMAESAP